MADYRAMARDAAVAHQLPSDRFVRQIGVESVDYAVNVIECRLDSPAGARGIAQLMPIHWSQVDPCNPHAALDYAARLMRGHWDYWLSKGYDADTAYGLALSSYNAGRQATIDGLAGKKAWWPFAETVQYLVRILQIDEGQARAIMTGVPTVPTTVTYNPDAKITPQPDDWSCAVRSAQWILRAVGRNPGDAWIVQHLLDEGVVTRERGLMDGSGATLAAWLNREYGAEGGWTAQSAARVTFDDVAAGAGVNPTLVGGHGWGNGGHWSGVRRLNADGSLELANPANGYTGIGQRITRAEWDARGPWSAIWIDRAGAVAEPPIVLPPEDTRVTRARELMRQALAVLDEPAA